MSNRMTMKYHCKYCGVELKENNGGMVGFDRRHKDSTGRYKWYAVCKRHTTNMEHWMPPKEMMDAAFVWSMVLLNDEMGQVQETDILDFITDNMVEYKFTNKYKRKD